MTHITPFEIEAHELSHVGKVREDNQDSLRICAMPDASGYLFAVADGMGGYEHGGVASALALDTLTEIVCGRGNAGIEQTLRRGVTDANTRVYQESLRRAARMGTTLTAVYIEGSRSSIAHIGDSRAYLIRDGVATCLTNDHTTVGELVRARILTPDKVRHHAQRSVLNRCLGMNLFVQTEISGARLISGDILILCSDGLWSVIEDAEIALLADKRERAETIAERLIERALANDSDDNISALVIHARSIPESAPETAPRRSLIPAVLRRRLFA